MEELPTESNPPNRRDGDPETTDPAEMETTSRVHQVHADPHPIPGRSRIGQTVGQYTLKRTIGSGGMGTVFEAVQENPRRRVAIKMIKRGVASSAASRRFEFEAQLLARLKHPCIAEIYDAGTHDDGEETVPYFVMEYIANAKTITEYAEEHHLGTRERMKLFTQVCDAVQHGHLKGIVHRDLKPGNVLVDSSGRPRIIDFGVARATDSDMAHTTVQTDVGQLVGTLQYMSPEQVEADPSDIDARSDVYALGIMLYELLTTQLPYDVANAAIHEAVRMVREEEPTKLSTIDRHLKGDVETITLKALEKDRDRRYQSALELERDISRYLAGEAISARSPGAIDFLRRFAKRHKAAAISLASIFVVLVAAVVAISIFALETSRQRNLALEARDEAAEQSTAAQLERDRANTQAKIAEDERDRATEQERHANSVKAFTTNMLSAVNPDAPGVTHKEQMKNVLAEASKSVGVRFQDQPLVEAELRTMIGSNYMGMGLYDEANPHLVKSLEIYRANHGEDHPATINATTSLGSLRWKQARYDEAETLWQAALAGNRRLHGDFDERTLNSIDHMGSIMLSLGRLDEAEAAYREALAGRAHTHGQESELTLVSVGNLGLVLLYKGQMEEAEFQLRKALDGRRKVLGADHPKTLWSINSMGILLRQQGRTEEAIPFLREGAEGNSRVLGDEHPSTLDAMNNLANGLFTTSAYDEAEAIYRQTLETRKRVLGDDHPESLKSQTNLAALYLATDRPELAEPMLGDVLTRSRAIHGDGHPRTLEALSNHAESLINLERYEEAIGRLDEVLAGQEKDLGPTHPDVIETLTALADLQEKAGDPQAAERLRATLADRQAERPTEDQ
ncbi:MAG: tetratricopeptide repeat protein [Phycisphaerales bacterium]|nr:tetratricopeptide repeat protein [Phycisphaerales bacterium]